MKANERYAYYGEQLVSCADRLLSALNRCPVSSSGGCLDREYWAWCTKDFANMDRQRGLLILAYLYATPFEGNPHAGEKAVLDWTIMAGDFWAREMGRKKGLDHLYAFENSWMAAAFTLVDIVAAYDLLADQMPQSSRQLWEQGIRMAAQRLISGDELHGFISNHRMGAAAALLGSARVTGDATLARHAATLVEGVLDHQSPEGFFLEYEGADPGYETLGLHYCARVASELNTTSFDTAAALAERLTKGVARSIDFLAYFVHPDDSIGGDYGSRGCMHFFPGGMEYFGHTLPMAEAVSVACCRGLATSRCSGLHDSDERNEVPLATSYVYAHATLKGIEKRPEVALPWTTEHRELFMQAGLFVTRTEHYQLVLGGSRGGVLRIYDTHSKQLVYSDYGYSAELDDGKPVASFHTPMGSGMTFSTQTGDTGAHLFVSLHTPFCGFDTSREMTTPGLLAFRLFSATLGRVPFFSNLMRKLIITRHVTRKKTVDAHLSRSLELHSDRVVVKDSVETGADTLHSLKRHGFMATSYMASARYFKRGDHQQSWTDVVELSEGQPITKTIHLTHDEDAS